MFAALYYTCVTIYVFFFKQKTAYEMRISDWSSDVCSSDLAALRKAMEDRWIPEMQSLLSIADHDLPLLWDADFLFRARKSANDSPYVLCEINASSVAPFPPSAVQPVAAAAVGRALAGRLRKETSNPH